MIILKQLKMKLFRTYSF
uniref:Uncharacterized protein n=1 Tax=Rhizophora mucronata TaxID=61149 RepID=A0A2P2NJE2_RHIMU